MIFAKYSSSFGKKIFSFHVGFTKRTVEALWVIVVVKSLHPPIACFYWETTVNTLGGEKFIPIFFAIGQSVFKIERGVGEYFATISTSKAFWMKSFAHCLQTVLSLNFSHWRWFGFSQRYLFFESQLRMFMGFAWLVLGHEHT